MDLRQLLFPVALATAAISSASPVAARVTDETPASFVIRLGIEVPASQDEVWQTMVRPEQWWDSADSFSGDAANLSLEPRAGGCFCEVLPDKEDPEAPALGGVQHMRVIYAEAPRALRLTGALGPMQPDPVNAVMTMELRASAKGTRVIWEYAVSGLLRKPGMAGVMDAMLTDQLLRLGEKLGVGPAAGNPAADKDAAAIAPGGADKDTPSPKSETVEAAFDGFGDDDSVSGAQAAGKTKLATEPDGEERAVSPKPDKNGDKPRDVGR